MAEEQDVAEDKARAKRPMASCRECGSEFAPQRQVERLKKKLGEGATMIEVCPACRRKLYARGLYEAHRKTTSEQAGGP